MVERRKIEIFSAGRPACTNTIETVKVLAGSSSEVEVLDMRDENTSATAGEYGVGSLPAAVIEGTLAGWCAGRGIDEEVLTASGIGASSA